MLTLPLSMTQRAAGYAHSAVAGQTAVLRRATMSAVQVPPFAALSAHVSHACSNLVGAVMLTIAGSRQAVIVSTQSGSWQMACASFNTASVHPWARKKAECPGMHDGVHTAAPHWSRTAKAHVVMFGGSGAGVGGWLGGGVGG